MQCRGRYNFRMEKAHFIAQRARARVRAWHYDVARWFGADKGKIKVLSLNAVRIYSRAARWLTLMRIKCDPYRFGRPGARGCGYLYHARRFPKRIYGRARNFFAQYERARIIAARWRCSFIFSFVFVWLWSILTNSSSKSRQEFVVQQLSAMRYRSWPFYLKRLADDSLKSELLVNSTRKI